jgi:hypothetical protein
MDRKFDQGWLVMPNVLRATGWTAYGNQPEIRPEKRSKREQSTTQPHLRLQPISRSQHRSLNLTLASLPNNIVLQIVDHLDRRVHLKNRTEKRDDEIWGIVL